MHREETLRAQVLRAAHSLHARGWVANHDGNVTARLSEDRLLATPTAESKGAVTPEALIVVDTHGQVKAGTRKSFSEIKLHLACYAARGDVQAVVHAHPPTATGLAVAGVELGEPFMAEPVVSLGRSIPLLPFALPGDNDPQIASALAGADVLMLGNHGVLAVGPDLDTCLLRIELLEHLCKVFVVAQQLGGPRRLSPGLVDALQRKHEGLFPRKLTQSGGSWSQPSGPAHSSSADASSIVAEAMKRWGG